MSTWRLEPSRLIVVMVTTVLLVAFPDPSWAERFRLIRTAQMWGMDSSEGKPTAVGIAAECALHEDETLTCQFVSIGGDKGTCVVSTWSERLRVVRKTSEVITWAGTRGPEGLAGAMTSTTLIAEVATSAKGQRDYLKIIPASVDRWTYKSATSYAAPEIAKPLVPLLGKGVVPTTSSTEVKSTASASALRCGNTAIMAVSPLAEETVSPRTGDQ